MRTIKGRTPVLCFVCAAAVGHARTVDAVGCSSAQVQAAIDAANPGDTVAVPACLDGVWTTSVTIPNTAGITLQGAGAGLTVISAQATLTLDTLLGQPPVRVTGFRFNRADSNPRVLVLGTAQDWRIDHNIFDDQGVSGPYTISVGVKGNENLDSYNYGLVDHNQFLNRNYATSIHVSWVRWGTAHLDQVASGDWVWAQPAQRGTSQAVYVEDNVFGGTLTASQVVDTQYGAKVVVRYNQIHNPWISTHSGCTNGGRHSPWTEVYGNTFTDDANHYGGNPVEMRSTSGIVWGNVATTPLEKYAISVDHERSYRLDCVGAYGGAANGSQPFDENAGPHGYRALGQPGWGPPQVANMGAATFAGVFAWNNSNGSAQVNLEIGNNNGYTSEHLQFGRELFNSTNIATGVRASMPSTCSVAPVRSVYVATDENPQRATLYVCSSPNVWSLHWEPWAYPHPLTRVSAHSLGMPHNLRVVR